MYDKIHYKYKKKNIKKKQQLLKKNTKQKTKCCQILKCYHDKNYMWNLRNNINESIFKTETDSQT